MKKSITAKYNAATIPYLAIPVGGKGVYTRGRVSLTFYLPKH